MLYHVAFPPSMLVQYPESNSENIDLVKLCSATHPKTPLQARVLGQIPQLPLLARAKLPLLNNPCNIYKLLVELAIYEVFKGDNPEDEASLFLHLFSVERSNWCQQVIDTLNQNQAFVLLDLTGAKLNGLNLQELDLCEANLNGACLIQTNLNKADLSRASLINADLSGAFLTGATLSEANLTYATLTDAHLYQANLEDANLTEAKMSNACLVKANCCGAQLKGADLAGTDFTGARRGT